MSHIIQIRMATIEDAERLLEIYTPYILQTPITFEYDVPTVAAFAQRIEKVLEKYPYLVAVEDNKIVGYAYASLYRTRAAYQWSVETSIYVDMEYHGKGIGTLLYSKLLEILEKQNVRNVYACVTLPNEKSEKIHKNFGFSFIGTFHGSGYKFDTWQDVGWFEKRFQVVNDRRDPVISIKILENRIDL